MCARVFIWSSATCFCPFLAVLLPPKIPSCSYVCVIVPFSRRLLVKVGCGPALVSMIISFCSWDIML